MFQPVATTDKIDRTVISFAMSKLDTTKVALVSHSDKWDISHLVILTMERRSAYATP
ncbi:MAG: branched-chain amino acid transport system substrate-binding protein [Burkholderiaceae bacterium]|jgi:branched-chain amino acid transport system substrate-binding protein